MPGDPIGTACSCGATGPRRLMEPMRLTILLPTASTAPRGDVRVGPSAAVSCTRNSLIAVPFHIPTVPRATCISLAKTKLQRRDSYQPSASGDHSNECTRMGDGSTPYSSASWIAFDVEAEGTSPVRPCLLTTAESCCITVRIVCKGNSGSQLSIH